MLIIACTTVPPMGGAVGYSSVSWFAVRLASNMILLDCSCLLNIVS